jgi:hypothetical protein
MRREYILKIATVVVSLGMSISCVEAAQNNKLPDSQIKKAIIKESIEQYPGNCPCPYNTASNGSICGKRSAYSRPGGYAPICYDSDVTKDMIREWRETHAKP